MSKNNKKNKISKFFNHKISNFKKTFNTSSFNSNIFECLNNTMIKIEIFIYSNCLIKSFIKILNFL